MQAADRAVSKSTCARFSLMFSTQNHGPCCLAQSNGARAYDANVRSRWRLCCVLLAKRARQSHQHNHDPRAPPSRAVERLWNIFMISVRQPAPPTTLQIALRHRIWRLSVDGVFHSDYRAKADAQEACGGLAQDLRARGAVVTMIGFTP